MISYRLTKAPEYFEIQHSAKLKASVPRFSIELIHGT